MNVYVFRYFLILSSRDIIIDLRVWYAVRVQIHFSHILYWIMPAIFTVGFPCGSAGKESSSNVGDLGLIPRLRRSPGEGKGYPIQYSILENSMDCIVHGVAEWDMTEQLSLSLL